MAHDIPAGESGEPAKLVSADTDSALNVANALSRPPLRRNRSSSISAHAATLTLIVFLRASRTCTPAPRDGSCPLRTSEESLSGERWRVAIAGARELMRPLRCGAPIAFSFSMNSPVSSGPQRSLARGTEWKARDVAYPRWCSQRPSTRRAPRTAASPRP